MLSGCCPPPPPANNQSHLRSGGPCADARRAGDVLFQEAHKGLLFLEEVGSLWLGLRANGLTAVEEGRVGGLGSARDEPVDVWIGAATSEDLRTAVQERRFRED